MMEKILSQYPFPRSYAEKNGYTILESRKMVVSAVEGDSRTLGVRVWSQHEHPELFNTIIYLRPLTEG